MSVSAETLAGDRRATQGNVIANRDMDKLFRTDEFSAVAIAGSAGIGIEPRPEISVTA